MREILTDHPISQDEPNPSKISAPNLWLQPRASTQPYPFGQNSALALFTC